jgi:hypothetical protein
LPTQLLQDGSTGSRGFTSFGKDTPISIGGKHALQ